MRTPASAPTSSIVEYLRRRIGTPVSHRLIAVSYSTSWPLSHILELSDIEQLIARAAVDPEIHAFPMLF